MNAPPTDCDTQTRFCDVLASAYRRQVLRYLVAGEDDVASVENLVDELLSQDEITDDRRHVAIELHHVALPKLAEAGFIEYDARTRTVCACEHPSTEWRAFPANVEGA
ncbi:DUF7344 domain-containing protein [Natronosalvus rutilus]|uniref:DUF7344 domain-containing protein n=1 Tax=Natronosalvus rutilus TaxID=2953753 RepID=A0A9E7N763_9EURY|nr:hypothetical protein [Natronosalvus rutilus]UTF52964.1 hypothetical protein NGM29_14440 [Natronosalvus rutilus]